MNVETILGNKGQDVATIRPGETTGTAIETLVSRNIGSLVVSEDGESVDGIISERDIIHALARHGTDLRSLI
jgi:CBS domain-containing protein